MEKQFVVYILTNKPYGVLYTGVTSNLLQRLAQHNSDAVNGFTQKYQAHRLVYYELHAGAEQAIPREKQLKRWKREWKIRLIEEMNAGWHDLSEQAA